MKEIYDFMRMPCEFTHSPASEESAVAAHHWRNDAVSPFPEKTPIGMAYVPYQQWGEIYEANEGFCRGTMFPELDYPFKGGDCSYE